MNKIILAAFSFTLALQAVFEGNIMVGSYWLLVMAYWITNYVEAKNRDT